MAVVLIMRAVMTSAHTCCQKLHALGIVAAAAKPEDPVSVSGFQFKSPT